MELNELELGKAREARAAIERLYIEMRHLFNRGWYRQLGDSGEVLTDALLTLSPEIYGSIGDPNKVELEGLVYVIDRLPKGIEACRYVKLISEEGYSESGFDVIIPAKRRRNCYRIDEDQMFIEVTRGRSEIYDILTHLTFMYIEAKKIMNHVLDDQGDTSLEWKKLEGIVIGDTQVKSHNEEKALTYLSTILGRSFAETRSAYKRLQASGDKNNGLFEVVYWLGHIALQEKEDKEKIISLVQPCENALATTFMGEKWATQIKQFLLKKNLMNRPLHIVSANPHSMMNSLHAWPALRKTLGKKLTITEMALKLSQPEHESLREKVHAHAIAHGMYELDDPLVPISMSRYLMLPNSTQKK